MIQTKTFNKHYPIMKKFYEIEGHSCIPPKGKYDKAIPGVSETELKKCGRFVSHLRSVRRIELEQGKVGKFILPFMVQKLKGIDFEYKVATNQNSKKFSRLAFGLADFVKENGHCNVTAVNSKIPGAVPDLPILYEWARSSSFGRARMLQLQGFGFSFLDESVDTIPGVHQ